MRTIEEIEKELMEILKEKGSRTRKKKKKDGWEVWKRKRKEMELGLI